MDDGKHILPRRDIVPFSGPEFEFNSWKNFFKLVFFCEKCEASAHTYPVASEIRPDITITKAALGMLHK
jgi:hypothetical protein